MIVNSVLPKKVLYKGIKLLLSRESFYDRVHERLKDSPVSLPASEEADSILMRASRRPAGGIPSPVRHWPEMPAVDVSIVIPCYNVKSFIEECIASIGSQSTSRSFEAIAVDDGSIDGTAEVLDRLAAERDWLRVIHQENRGFSGARNRALEACRGRTIMFVDSDDMLEPDAIEVLADEYERGQCDFVTASYENLSEDGRTRTPINGKRQHGAPWGRLYSREIWRTLEFPEGFWFEDTMLWFCISGTWSESYVDVPVYLYRRNSHGITRTASANKRALDTLWIVDELLTWCGHLGIPSDLALYEKVLTQFGPILFWRTLALSEAERRAMFVHACGTLERFDPDRRYSTSLGSRWGDIELGLRERNYLLWKTAAISM